mgnify:CR=1 FL=1
MTYPRPCKTRVLRVRDPKVYQPYIEWKLDNDGYWNVISFESMVSMVLTRRALDKIALRDGPALTSDALVHRIMNVGTGIDGYEYQ